MRRTLFVLLRLFHILAGYGAASLAAGIFLHLVAFPLVAMPGEPPPWTAMGGLLFSVPLVTLFVSYFAFFPAAVLIGMSEVLSYRSWIYHALSGAAAGFAAILLARHVPGADFQPMDLESPGQTPLVWMPEITAAALAAGIVGGIAYWLVCGRFAGRARRSERLPQP